MIFFDLETYKIEYGVIAPKPVCITTSVHGIVRWREFVSRFMDDFLTHDLCGHNVAYDIGVMWEHAPLHRGAIVKALEEGRVHCTMLREGYIDIAKTGQVRETSLVDLCSRYAIENDFKVGEDGSKEEYWRTRYGLLANEPVAEWPADAVRYALEDVRVLPLIFAKQTASRVPFDDVRTRVRGSVVLNTMSSYPSMIDVGATNAKIAELVAEKERCEETLRACGLMRANGTKDRKAALAEAGTERVDKNTIKTLSNPNLDALTRHASIVKILARLEAISVGRSVTRYRPLLATGRTSCSGGKRKGTDQRQNWDRGGGYRDFFIAREGHVFVDADWSAAELSALATINGPSSKMGEMIRAGIDLHMRIGAAVIGVPYEQAMRDKPRYKGARQQGKAGNFGFGGGMGITLFIQHAKDNYGVVLTEAEATRLKRTWLQTYPEMQEYFARANDLVERGGYVRCHKSGRLRGKVGYTEACNTPFQALAADMAFDALWRVWLATKMDRKSPLFGGGLWAFIHDQIVIEVREERAEECARELKKIMEDCGRYWCDVAPPAAEVEIKKRWSK